MSRRPAPRGRRSQNTVSNARSRSRAREACYRGMFIGMASVAPEVYALLARLK